MIASSVASDLKLAISSLSGFNAALTQSAGQFLGLVLGIRGLG